VKEQRSASRYEATRYNLQVLFKYLVLAVLALILISLAKALYHLSGTRADDDGKMVKALAWRIGLSVALFVLLIIGYYLGWIDPPHLR
jgi:formate/nitrite transporter FocA (FNT family)